MVPMTMVRLMIVTRIPVTVPKNTDRAIDSPKSDGTSAAQLSWAYFGAKVHLRILVVLGDVTIYGNFMQNS